MSGLPSQDDIPVVFAPPSSPSEAPTILPPNYDNWRPRNGRNNNFRASVSLVTGLSKRGRPSSADLAAAGDNPSGLRFSFDEATEESLEKERLRMEKQAATKAASLKRGAAAKAARAAVREEKAKAKAKLAGLKKQARESSGKGRRASYAPPTPAASIGDVTNWTDFTTLGGETAGTSSPQAGPSGSWATTPSTASTFAPSPAVTLPFEISFPLENLSPDSTSAPNTPSTSTIYFHTEQPAYPPTPPLRMPFKFQDPIEAMFFGQPHETPMDPWHGFVPSGFASAQVDPVATFLDAMPAPPPAEESAQAAANIEALFAMSQVICAGLQQDQSGGAH